MNETAELEFSRSAARRYVRACNAVEGADSASVVARHVECDAAYHDLCVAVGESCALCEAESCPGYVER